MTEEAASYIRAIRNPIKRAYAEKYAAWNETGGAAETEPLVPVGLSYMAAQAVRMTLAALWPYKENR